MGSSGGKEGRIVNQIFKAMKGIKTMKKTILAGLLMAPALVLTSCSSNPEGQGETVVAAQPGVPGGTIIQTYQVTATVKSIDADTRKVTLTGPDGKDFVVKCG